MIAAPTISLEATKELAQRTQHPARLVEQAAGVHHRVDQLVGGKVLNGRSQTVGDDPRYRAGALGIVDRPNQAGA